MNYKHNIGAGVFFFFFWGGGLLKASQQLTQRDVQRSICSLNSNLPALELASPPFRTQTPKPTVPQVWTINCKAEWWRVTEWVERVCERERWRVRLQMEQTNSRARRGEKRPFSSPSFQFYTIHCVSMTPWSRLLRPIKLEVRKKSKKERKKERRGPFDCEEKN